MTWRDAGLIAVCLGLAGAGVAGLVATAPGPSAEPSASAGAAADPSALGEVVTISTGEEVDVAAYLDPERRTVVEFGAEW